METIQLKGARAVRIDGYRYVTLDVIVPLCGFFGTKKAKLSGDYDLIAKITGGIYRAVVRKGVDQYYAIIDY